MSKEINIEKLFCPKAYELQGSAADGEGLFAEISDMELDTFRVDFKYDGCAEIHTEGMAYIVLHAYDLRRLADLVEKADRKYKKHFKNEKH